MRSSNAIDSGVELEAVVVSDTTPLMVAQKRKRRRDLSRCRQLNQCGVVDEAAAVDESITIDAPKFVAGRGASWTVLGVLVDPLLKLRTGSHTGAPKMLIIIFLNL
jgi:hypothetical protein